MQHKVIQDSEERMKKALESVKHEMVGVRTGKASPSLLEPIYEFVIFVPDTYAGDVMSALKTKRAQVMGMDQRGNKTVITAHAPLAEMQRFGNDLRSLTQGRGVFELKFDRYARVPPALAEPIIAKHKAELAAQKEE